MISIGFELNRNTQLDVILSDRLKRALDDYEELLRCEKEAIEGLIQ